MRINKISMVAALALGGLLVCSTFASAQTSPEAKDGKKTGRRAPSVDQRLDRMTTELQLTEAQKPKVKAVLEDTAKKRQAMRSDTNVPQEERRTKMQALMKEENKKLKEILTPEQQEKYQKLIEEQRKNRGGGGKKRDATKQE